MSFKITQRRTIASINESNSLGVIFFAYKFDSAVETNLKVVQNWYYFSFETNPTREVVSPSAVEPLVCEAFLQIQLMGQVRFPSWDAISSHIPPVDLVL